MDGNLPSIIWETAMPAPKPPSYRRKKIGSYDYAVVSVGKRDYYLGEYGSKESQAEYKRLIAEWSSGNLKRPGGDTSVNEVLLTFWRHAEMHYRDPDGNPTSELANFQYALEPVKEVYGHTRAADFDSLALETVRNKMVEAGHCRTRVNRDVQRIKHAFRWAASKRLISASVSQLLDTVEGLRKGRTPAHETEPVRPVAEEVVTATLPFLRPQPAAMAQLQLLTGMRPGEVVIIRMIDLDRSGKVWMYRPRRHKTEHHGHGRTIMIGPRGQEVLKPWLLRFDKESYIFSPTEAEAQRSVERHAARRTPGVDKRPRKSKRKRRPGEHYTVDTYSRAIRRACIKADAAARASAIAEGMPADEAKDKVFVPHWHPNQLRHTKATEIRREAVRFGMDGRDAARVVLGHRSPQVTEVYAEIDTKRAAEVMEKLG
jgi:integrase